MVDSRSKFSSLAVVLVLLCTWAGAPSAASSEHVRAGAADVVRIPDDVANLEVAVSRVKDGGTIVFRAGTYLAPPNGWSVRGATKSFAVRAETPGSVVLDGAGSARIVDVGPAPNGRGVELVGLTFRGGSSTAAGLGGALTVEGRQVTLRNCLFEDNVGHVTGGGALRVRAGAEVVSIDTVFRGNTSTRRGGAVEADLSTLLFDNNLFEDNRVNDPGHSWDAVGGALYLVDSRVRIVSSTFDSNQAAWVGGAIYAFGTWQSDETELAATLDIFGSRFTRNFTAPRTPSPGTNTGGALHIEDSLRTRIFHSDFEGNVSNRGGAISSYRSQLEVYDSSFRANLADLSQPETAAGGAIIHASADFVDSSTASGALNRPTGSVLVRGSHFFSGSSFGTSDVSATQGGCLALLGDTPRELGDGGVPRAPNLARNRVPVVLDQVLLQCNAGAGTQAGVFGGSVYAQLAQLEITDTLILGSRADGGVGGAVASLSRSSVVVEGSTFAGNSSDRGGAIYQSGGELHVEDGLFLENRVDNGLFGSAVYTQTEPASTPDRQGIDGRVTGSVFARNTGLTLYELDSKSGPFNTVRYGNNDFEGASTDDILVNTASGFDGHALDSMNSLLVTHGAQTTRKATSANRVVASAPGRSRLVGAPGRVTTGTGYGADIPSVIGWASSTDNARLGGVTQTTLWGALVDPGPGRQTLSGGGDSGDVDVTENSGSGVCDAELCLNGDRFLVEVSWEDFAGGTGRGQVVPYRSDDSGLLYFFQADNWEMLLKILDGCPINGSYWLLAAATTTVAYELAITDLATGRVVTYANPLGNAADAITDTSSLSCAGPSSRGEPQLAHLLQPAGHVPPRVDLARHTHSAGAPACGSDTSRLCLGAGRFQLSVTYRDFSGSTGSARVVSVGSADSGLFYFFDAANWEMLVKVLDGCGVNGHHWVLAAATTDVEYTLRVVDTATGEEKSYFNPLGRAAPAIADTSAFSSCP